MEGAQPGRLEGVVVDVSPGGSEAREDDSEELLRDFRATYSDVEADLASAGVLISGASAALSDPDFTATHIAELVLVEAKLHGVRKTLRALYGENKGFCKKQSSFPGAVRSRLAMYKKLVLDSMVVTERLSAAQEAHRSVLCADAGPRVLRGAAGGLQRAARPGRAEDRDGDMDEDTDREEAEVQARKAKVAQLEGSIEQLRTMFLELSSIAEENDAMLKKSESMLDDTTKRVKKTNESLVKALDHMEWERKKRMRLMGICAAVVAAVAVAAVVALLISRSRLR